MRGRVLKLLSKMPELAGQFQGRGKDSFQVAILTRALPGLLPMVTGTINKMEDERLLSFINFIRNTLELMGNPEVSDEQFNAFLEGKVVDASSSTQHANTAG